MFIIKTNLKAQIDENGKKYIINPLTKERLYEYIPPLVENSKEPVLANLPIISGLFAPVTQLDKEK